ncbi:MAG: hypothetical protein A3E25_20575 [Burkholderiales bacterium RIFCSPHIGHO2_12_FULL_69_20]|nr:MAG: hypothetical protein A3E25_20575 [Burkholderiales bacterium RIFCSPHIGHO2_12_FULL_69_20]
MRVSLQDLGTAPGSPAPARRPSAMPGSQPTVRMAEPPRADAAPINRVLACMAGFFRLEAEALAAAQQLARTHGLSRAQCVLLGPVDATPRRFDRHARRWASPWQTNGRPPWSDHWRRAGAVLLLGALLAAVWWWPDWHLSDDLYWPTLAATPLAGAGLVALVTAFWRRVPRPRRFDLRVREQLASGAWAVVVHDVPAERQAGVVALLRGSSLKWCGEAAPAQRL